MQEEGYDGAEAHQERIIEIWDDGCGRDAGEARRHQQLRPVRDQALHQAGEGVQQAGRLLRRHAEALRDVVRDAAGGDDRHGVVGRAEIGQADDAGDGRFGAAPAADALGERRDDEIEAAADADQLQQAAGEQGHDDQLGHPGDALSDGAQPVHPAQFAGEETEQRHERDAGREDHGDVEAAEGQRDDQQVRQRAIPFDGRRYGRLGHFPAPDHVEDGDGQEGRQDDAQVRAELVAHLAARRTRGGDGRIGDEGKVVAEEGAAHDDGGHIGLRDTALGGDAGPDGDQRHDGAHARAHRHRDEAGSHEQAGKQPARRHGAEHQRHGRVHGADLARGLREGARQQEDPDHQQDIGMPRSAGKGSQALRQRAFRHGDAVNAREQERRGHGYLVEVPRNHGGYEINQQENSQRTDGQQAFRNTTFHDS